MKKVLIVLALVVVLIAAAGIWFWSSMGFTHSAKLVPDTAVAYMALPDLARAALRWPQTTLAKIGAEPDVKAFLEKPLQYLTKSGSAADDTADILMRLKPQHIFASLNGIGNQSAAIIGFQFWGSGADCDAAFARLRQAVSKDQTLPTMLEKDNHEGDEITASVHDGITLFTAHHGHWGFISNNLAAIKDALDRSTGRSKSPSLADTEPFKTSFSHLPKDADFLLFTQPQPLVDALLAAGATMGAQPIPQQVEQLRKVEAIAATIKLDGANLRDSIFVLRRNPPHNEDLTHQAMKFTTKETTIYFDFVADFQQIFTLAQSPSLAALVNSPAVQSSQLPKLLPEAFGPECGLVLTWQEAQDKPNGVAAIQVRDQAKAEAALQELLTLVPQTTITDLAGVKAYSFPNLQGLLANPTFALHSGFLLVGLEADDIQRAIVAVGAKDPLDRTETFKSVLPEYKSANEVFGFIDLKKIFNRSYPLARQILIFSAAVMPGSNEIIEAGKLPDTEVVARHLQPIVYAQTRLDDGYLIESRGPITLNQAVIGGAGAAGSIFKPATGQ